MDPYTLVNGHQFYLLFYHSELHGCCGQSEWQCLKLVCPTLDVKPQIFPGLFLYWYVEVGILKSIEVTHSPCWREVLMVSGVSILNFSALRKRFNFLRSRMGLQRLFGFGTKKSRLKKPRDFWFCTNSTVFLFIS